MGVINTFGSGKEASLYLTPLRREERGAKMAL
jgi:hypothetical protein